MSKPDKELGKMVPITCQKKQFDFNFGPISRTLGEAGDYLGFASLPIHEAVAALLGASNREEFIAWLYHDTFKALFNVDNKESPKWLHVPGKLDSANLERNFNIFAQTLGIDPCLAKKHHMQGIMSSEKETIANEFGSLYLGSKARFVQLSFASQPTAHTIPMRQCINESFLRAASQVVAKGITALKLPFTSALYKFYQKPEKLASEQIAALYQLQVLDEKLEIIHWIPSEQFETIQLSLNLIDEPPHRGDPTTFSLIELLTIYRDELTTVVAIPLFLDDPHIVVEEIRATMGILVPKIFEEIGIEARHDRAQTHNLLDVVLKQMVEVRLIAENFNETYDAIWKGKRQKKQGKPIHKLIQRPYQLMADKARSNVCMVCGTPISQEVADCYQGSLRLQHVFSSNFPDYEHVSFSGAICPLCLIYANNNKGLLRGAQAFLSPSTALNLPMGSVLIEQPRFDAANRFDQAKPLPKTVITLQEMVLLTIISRRIVDMLLPFEVESDGHMMEKVKMNNERGDDATRIPVSIHLPYAGVYMIYAPKAVRLLYQDVLIGSKSIESHLWQTVQLQAYPFRLELSPAFMLQISLKVNASHFSGRHTLLKSCPTQVFLSPNASFNLLVDNAIQETVNSELAEAIRLVRQLADMPGLNKNEFIKALLTGYSLLEAVYLAAKRSSKCTGETFRLTQAQRFWNRDDVAVAETTEEQWMNLSELTKQVQTLAQAHPTLLSLV